MLDENIKIAGVDKDICAASLELAKMHDMGINDCMAAVIMKMKGIREIYSFDTDFDEIEGIKRVGK